MAFPIVLLTSVFNLVNFERESLKKLEIYQCVRYPHLGPLYERKVLPDMTDSLILKIISVVICQYADIYYRVCQVPSIYSCYKEQKEILT